MAIKILQIDLQNDITPQIGSYDNTGGVTSNNWINEGGVYSLGPTNRDGTTPYYWFTPTKEVTDFDLCWEDYQDHEQTTPQYHLEIGDSAGNVVLSVSRSNQNYGIGPVGVGNLAYQTWHKILIEVRKASASSSTVTAYVDGKKIDTGTSDTLLTSAKIALLGHVPDSYYWQNAGQRLRYVTIYDRSYTSKGINLDGMMTAITVLISKLRARLSTVAFTGSYNDLKNKPTISTVNNGTLTIQQNGTTVDSFSANSNTNKTANIQCVDLSTAQTISGVKTFTSNMVIQGGKKVLCNLDNSYIELDGGTAWGKGGSIVLSGQDRSSYSNAVLIVSKSDTNTDILQYQNGELKPLWNNTSDSSLGTSTNQWKSVYSQTYYYNGTAWGLDKVNEWTDTNTFSKTNSDTIQLKNGRVAIGETLSSDAFTQLSFKDKNTDNLAYIRNNYIANGTNNLDIYVRNKFSNGSPSTTGSLVYAFFGLSLDNTGKSYARLRGDFYPYTDNLYSLGTSTNKWSKVYSDDVVHTTGNETIGGIKTFSQETTMFGRDINLMSRLHYGKNSNPSAASWNYLFFRGNTATEGYTDSWYSGYLEQLLNTNGSARGRWLIRDTSENSVCLELSVNGSDKQVRPQENNAIDLGTSTNKWKSFNGINPGALSLPNTTGLINVASSITVLDGSTANTFTPQVNGWLLINGTGSANDAYIYVTQGRIGMTSANNSAWLRCAVLIPVVAGVEVSITCKLSTLTWANIVPCQGNV